MPSSKLVVSEPSSSEDFSKYYALRYEVLRKPWQQPVGSEKDADEENSIHAFIKENDRVLAVGRLQFVDADSSQVRFMAVAADQQGRGLGRKVLEYLEGRSLAAGRQKVLLHARENALEFYKSCGYSIKEKSHLLWGQVQHWLMEKELVKDIIKLAHHPADHHNPFSSRTEVKVLFANSETLDDVCNFFDKGDLKKIAQYPIIKFNTRDYIRIVVLKHASGKYFAAALIDPEELWDNIYVKRVSEIDDQLYNYLIHHREQPGDV